jgi:hypothetical protein
MNVPDVIRDMRCPATFRVTRCGVLVVALVAMLIAGLSGCSSPSYPAPGSPAIAHNNATPTSQADPAGRSTPVRVQIPAIAVDATLMDLGLRDNGTMEVPPDGSQAGWYTGAPAPGELGPAVIAGHVDWGGQPGVFYHLRTLKPDDRIVVAREDGTTVTFRVTRSEQVLKSYFPTKMVYGNIDHAGLRLITCGGSFDPQARSYDRNVIVFAELVDGGPPGVETR